MKQKLFFQSSLPRAGSTLLQNIVAHNPDFYSSPTSGLVDLMLGTRIGYNENPESKAASLEEWKAGFLGYCRAGFDGYMKALTDKPYFFDKSRAWGPYYSLLEMIVPNPKVVYMVRDFRAIYSSMEKLFRKNPDVDPKIMNNIDMTGITTDQRVTHWANTHPVGFTITKLHQCLLDGTAKNFLFFKYEEFCQSPDEHMKSLYEFFELPYYQHDWNDIKQITHENDAVHGIFGDHKIRNKLEAQKEDFYEILGNYTCDRIKNEYKWFYDYFNYQ